MKNSLKSKLEELNKYRPLSKEELKQLDKIIKYEHIWSSNAIEGNSLTENETIAILENDITVAGKPLKDHLEVINLSQAYDFVKELITKDNPLEVRDINDINRLVTLNTKDDNAKAGVFREIDVWPNGHPDRKYVDPFQIKDSVENFVKWYNESKDIDPVEKAALAHAKLVSIHPYIDGNGRTSRLIMNMTLTRNGYPAINIQPYRENRKEYMNSLSEYQETGNPDNFIDLVSKYEEKELDKRIELLKRNSKNLEKTEQERKEFSKRFSKSKEKGIER